MHAKTTESGGYQCRRRCCRGNAILARALPLRNSVLVVTMDHTAFDGGGAVGRQITRTSVGAASKSPSSDSCIEETFLV